MPTVLLAYYCALILVASIIGGMIPVWFQLTHRWMQFAVSFVAGVMLGIGVLHMLPHALMDATLAATVLLPTTTDAVLTSASVVAIRWITISLLAGMLTMFFIERFFSFHHHDVPEDTEHEHGHDHEHDAGWLGSSEASPQQVHADGHDHHTQQPADLSWSGAALGLALHSMLNGVALAAAVQCESSTAWLAGFGTFLVIFLHKPFDAMTISMLMAHSGWSLPWRHTINGLFSLAIPVGALVFYFGLMPDQFSPDSANRQWYIACALAFSAGTFLCISLSDLLPELQFHRHDRVMLSAALLLGLGVAHVAAWFEGAVHPPHLRPPVITSANR